MNYIDFSYWLQGYFEITKQPYLDSNKIFLIKEKLSLIEDRHEFTEWLGKVCHHIDENNNDPKVINYFMPIIQRSLSSFFYHAVDDSYEGVSREVRHKIHEEGIDD